jgi:hypothetical protein
MTGDEWTLDDLRYHWGDAYLIHRAGGRWVAQRRDSHATLSADSAEKLLDIIREDYRLHPVPRDPRTCRLLPDN